MERSEVTVYWSLRCHCSTWLGKILYLSRRYARSSFSFSAFSLSCSTREKLAGEDATERFLARLRDPRNCFQTDLLLEILLGDWSRGQESCILKKRNRCENWCTVWSGMSGGYWASNTAPSGGPKRNWLKEEETIFVRVWFDGVKKTFLRVKGLIAFEMWEGYSAIWRWWRRNIIATLRQMEHGSSLCWQGVRSDSLRSTKENIGGYTTV